MVRGTYVDFRVDAATFGVSNWTLPGGDLDLDEGEWSQAARRVTAPQPGGYRLGAR